MLFVENVLPLLQELLSGPFKFPHGLLRAPEFIVAGVGVVWCCSVELPTTSINGALTVPALPVTPMASDVFEFT
jgi:hypothetical protein